MKTCSRCKKKLPSDEFRPIPSGKRSATCNSCLMKKAETAEKRKPWANTKKPFEVHPVLWRFAELHARLPRRSPKEIRLKNSLVCGIHDGKEDVTWVWGKEASALRYPLFGHPTGVKYA